VDKNQFMEEEPMKKEPMEEEPAMGFNEFGLDSTILKALYKMNFKEPSDIQIQTIPLIQEKRDLIALAQTGSGKTAACAIPVCNRVNVHRSEVQALIIVPTRGLALQYATETQKIGVYKGVKAFAIFGGEDAALQQSKLKHGVQVLIATPGRLIDFIYSRQIDLSHVETLILDEADEMLSMGFYEDLHFIIQCLVHEHQTLLFSATMPKTIRELARLHMKEPLEISLLGQDVSPSTIEHQFIYCHHEQRENALADLLEKLDPAQCIIFCHSRFQVEKVFHFLKRKFDGVDFLHAGLGQDIRTIVTSKFRSGKIRFLVATDVVSRGLDFSHISHVFIYQLPDDPDVYVHRSGRTGRYKKTGVVVSLVTNRELSVLNQILKKINREPIWIGSPPPPKTPSKPYNRYFKQKKN
jgi:ATP-dependent RNA helicase DeaD